MATVMPFGRQSARLRCPQCNANVLTATKEKPGIMAWVFCVLLVNACLCCVPFCCKHCLDTEHYCPNCYCYLGKHRAP
uniref:LITAF domain-containing protein n=1 Tax=Ditylenchus dipsaci TaxID=166011 RepID=A0A915DCM2_9BILA